MPYPTTALLTPDLSGIRRRFSPDEGAYVFLSDFYHALGYPVGGLSPSEHVAGVLAKRYPSLPEGYMDPSVRLFPDGDDPLRFGAAVIRLRGDIQMLQFKPEVASDSLLRGHILKFLDRSPIFSFLGLSSFVLARDLVTSELFMGYDSFNDLAECEPDLCEETFPDGLKVDPATLFDSKECFRPSGDSLRCSLKSLARYGIDSDFSQRAKRIMCLIKNDTLCVGASELDETPVEPYLISSFHEPVSPEWEYLESRGGYIDSNFGECFSGAFSFQFDGRDPLADAYHFDQIVSDLYGLARTISSLMDQVLQPYGGN